MQLQSVMFVFSPCKSRLSLLSGDGRLILWDSKAPNSPWTQYVPSSHLGSAPTCLAWSHSIVGGRGTTPEKSKKKKRRSRSLSQSEGNGNGLIAMGTTGGTILLYNVKQGDVSTVISVNEGDDINCLVFSYDSETIYAGSNNGTVFKVNLKKNSVTSTYTTGKSSEKLKSIALMPDEKTLVAASNIISWIDLESKKVLRTLMGHKSEVSLLKPVHDKFVISASADDHVLNVWNMGVDLDDNLNCTLSVNEPVKNVDVVKMTAGNEDFGVAVITKTGILKHYEHCFDGKKRKRPIKPSATIQIASEKDKTGKVPILPIFDGCYSDSDTLFLSYGSNTLKPHFESVKIEDLQKSNVFVRDLDKDATIKSDKKDDTSSSTLQVPDSTSSNTVLPPSAGSMQIKRKAADSTTASATTTSSESLTMLERLRLLSKDTEHKTTPPRTDSLLQLLLQGLHNQDRKILDSVLDRAEEELIHNTVKKLPVEAIIPLIQELQRFIKGRGMVNQPHVKWLRSVLTNHAGYLMSSPHCQELLSPLESMLTDRTRNYSNIVQLKGKLEILTKQISGRSEAAASNYNADKEALLVYQNDSDDDVSDVLDDLLLPASDTDDNWDNDDDEEEEEEDEDSDDKKDSDIEVVNGDDDEEAMDDSD